MNITDEQLTDAINGSPALKKCAYDLIRASIAFAKSPLNEDLAVEAHGTALALSQFIPRPRNIEELTKVEAAFSDERSAT